MRRNWKAIAGIILVPISHLGWFLDQLGRAQTVGSLPFLKWIFSPWFSPVAFIVAVGLISWGYYDLALRKMPAGFMGEPDKKPRLRMQIFGAALLFVMIFVTAPLGYRFYRSKSAKPTSPTAAMNNPVPPTVQQGTSSQGTQSASTQPATKKSKVAKLKAKASTKQPVGPEPASLQEALPSSAPVSNTSKYKPCKYARLRSVPSPSLLITECSDTPFPVEEPTSSVAVDCMKVDHILPGTTGNCQDVQITDNHTGSPAQTNILFQNAGKAEDINLSGSGVSASPTGSAIGINNLPGGELKHVFGNVTVGPSTGAPISPGLPTQLSQLIDEGRKITGTFVADNDVQALLEKDRYWQVEVEEILTTQMGAPFANQFRDIQAGIMPYPANHDPEAQAAYSLMTARINYLIGLLYPPSAFRRSAQQRTIECGYCLNVKIGNNWLGP